MMPSSSEMNELRTRRMVAKTSSWTIGCGDKPAAMFEMQEMPRTYMPKWRADMASGTVDMTTASAPMPRNNLISAGVS